MTSQPSWHDAVMQLAMTLGTLTIACCLVACVDADPDFSDGDGSDGVGGGTSAATSGATTGSAPNGPTGSGGDGGGGDAPACTEKDGAPGDFDLTVEVNGEERRFLLHVPAGVDASEAVPLVLGFHGFSASPEEFRDTSHMSELADERGFIAAYLEGTDGTWNGGACCGVAEWTNVNEVAFASAVIDAIEASYCVDEKRVHASGFSNGGFLSHRLGCELSSRIASIGVVAGQESLPNCAPTRPVAVLQIHGTADPVVPFMGNPILGYPTTDSTVDGWADRDACSDETTVTYDADGTTCERRSSCAEGADVELCKIDGGGHTWFGGGDAWTENGPPAGFVASIAIVDFFEAHPMP